MTEEQFQRLLETHDWWYMMSDDHRYYSKGRDEWDVIQKAMDSNKRFHTMYLDYMNKTGMN